jgi:hypothetical protein
MWGNIKELVEPELLERLRSYLKELGYQPTLSSSSIRLEKAGYSDQTVDLEIRLFDIDGHRVIKFESIVNDTAASFERASLALIQGNSTCHIVKFTLNELDLDHEHRFELRASTHMYADYFSKEEISSMTFLYLSELDEIDNQLREILERTPN